MQIFELFMEPITYITFITQFSPILLSFIAIIDSAYNTSLKGILYVFGVLLSFSIGKLISGSFPFRVPGIEDGMNEKDFGSSKLHSDKYAFKNPMFHKSCNLLSKPDHAGWGTFYSSPDMYALFFSFTLIYIISCMMGNNNINIFILTILIFFFILSSYFRTQIYYCVQFRDILIGLIIGSFIGFLWYLFVSIMETSLKIYDLTYFNINTENNNKCKMENKQFRCKKIKIDIENDDKISELKIKANQAALQAVKASNAINTKNNFKMIWDLYYTIINNEITNAENTNNNNTMYEYFETNKDNYTLNHIKDSHIIRHDFSSYSGKIYGIENNYNLSDYIDNTENIYLKNGINYKYYNKDGKIKSNNKQKPRIFQVLNTNFILFNNFISSYPESIDKPKIIDTIKSQLNIQVASASTNNSQMIQLPIQILKNTLTDMKDYTKITTYLLNNKN